MPYEVLVNVKTVADFSGLSQIQDTIQKVSSNFSKNTIKLPSLTNSTNELEQQLSTQQEISLAIQTQEAEMKNLINLAKQKAQADRLGLNSLQIQQRLTELIGKQSPNNLQKQVQITQALNKEVQKFDSSQLSLLFGFGAIAAVFNTFSRNAIRSYGDITQGQTAFSQQLIKAQAAFTFLQFQIADVIGNITGPLLDGFVQLTDILSDQPILTNLLGALVLLIGIGAAIGTAQASATLLASALNFGSVNLGLGAIIAGLDVLTLGASAAFIAFVLLADSMNFAGTHETLQVLGKDVTDLFGGLGKSLGVFIKGLGDVLTGFLRGNFDQLALGIAEVIVGLVGFVAKAVLGLAILIDNTFFALINLLGGLINSVLQIILGAIQKIATMLDLIAAASGQVTHFHDAVGRLRADIDNSFSPVDLSEFVNQSQINKMVDDTLKNLTGISPEAKKAGKNAGQSFSDAFTKANQEAQTKAFSEFLVPTPAAGNLNGVFPTQPQQSITQIDSINFTINGLDAKQIADEINAKMDEIAKNLSRNTAG